MATARASLQTARRVVVKVGSRALSGDPTLPANLIAQIAGKLQPGMVATWQVTHQVPIEEDERGRVTVSRIISGRNLVCKEIVFSIDVSADTQHKPQSDFYIATICRDAERWKWASAEPATERWGALQ